MEFTTHLELQSQTTRLIESGLHLPQSTHGALTLYGTLFQGILSIDTIHPTSTDDISEDYV